MPAPFADVSATMKYRRAVLNAEIVYVKNAEHFMTATVKHVTT